MKVVIIGTGNVATVLGRKILEAKHELIQIVGRDFEKTNLLALQLSATPVYNLRYISLLADIYIIAISDSSIQSVVENLRLKDKIVVHTAAAVSKSLLAVCSDNYGVLYPLQTLRKETFLLPDIPVLVDGNNETTTKFLTNFAKDWAKSVDVASDDKRLKLHVTAVFVSNFTNHLLSIGEAYCIMEKLNFNQLYPLIKETIARIKDQSPSALQTGPAARKDFTTIEKHMEILANHPQEQEMYKVLTNSILNLNNKSKSTSNSII